MRSGAPRTDPYPDHETRRWRRTLRGPRLADDRPTARAPATAGRRARRVGVRVRGSRPGLRTGERRAAVTERGERALSNAGTQVRAAPGAPA